MWHTGVEPWASRCRWQRRAKPATFLKRLCGKRLAHVKQTGQVLLAMGPDLHCWKLLRLCKHLAGLKQTR